MRMQTTIKDWKLTPKKSLKKVLESFGSQRLKEILREFLEEKSSFVSKNLEISKRGENSLSMGLSKEGAIRNLLNSPSSYQAFNCFRTKIEREALRRVFV